MTQALIAYALFLAEAATMVVLIGGLLVALIRALRGTPSPQEQLEFTDLNNRYRETARAIKHATLSGKALRKVVRTEAKEDKVREKSGEGSRRRVYVLDFHGDVRASGVTALRECITAVLLGAVPGDEVLVRLENAGGLVAEHGLAAAQLARVRARQMRLTVAVDKVAASGGYLMACVADRILAAPFAILGSIGVVAQLPNFHRVLERHGVDFELHTAGEHKRTLTLFGENTEAGREKLREQIEDTHRLFKDYIAEYRPALDLARAATGDYWHGRQALPLGLVDAIQTSDDYLLEVSAEADLLLVKYEARKGPVERLLAGLGTVLGRFLG